MELEYKDFRIVPTDFSMYRIMQLGKGAIPKFLNGVYTSPFFAKGAIDFYLANKDTKDGKTNSKPD